MNKYPLVQWGYLTYEQQAEADRKHREAEQQRIAAAIGADADRLVRQRRVARGVVAAILIAAGMMAGLTILTLFQVL